jgi:hypothetical protein
MELNFKEDLGVDPWQLAEDIFRYPNQVYAYGLHESQAQNAFDKAQLRLERTRAEVELDIRQDPDGHDLPKVTEAVIASAVSVNKAVQDAQDEVVEAKKDLNDAKIALETIRRKRTSLELAVQTLLAQYWAGPELGVETEPGRRWTLDRQVAREMESGQKQAMAEKYGKEEKGKGKGKGKGKK